MFFRAVDPSETVLERPSRCFRGQDDSDFQTPSLCSGITPLGVVCRRHLMPSRTLCIHLLVVVGRLAVGRARVLRHERTEDEESFDHVSQLHAIVCLALSQLFHNDGPCDRCRSHSHPTRMLGVYLTT